MGGKMNLNPLKKDDNTDALVKALEDANSASDAPAPAGSTTQVAAVPQAPNADSMQSSTSSTTPDDTIIASDPQVMGDSALNMTDALKEDEPTMPAEDTVSTGPPTPSPVDEVEMPAGLSSDADAHLSGEGTGKNGELDEVKKHALEQLRPLIEKLDLEPADKFDKYLMMLRATDDPTLIKPAYEAAKDIPGEKEKAQALLDVINEINYITANKK